MYKNTDEYKEFKRTVKKMDKNKKITDGNIDMLFLLPHNEDVKIELIEEMCGLPKEEDTDK